MITRTIITASLLAMLAACATTRMERDMNETMDAWAVTLRWTDNPDALIEFIHPEYLEENPIDEEDLRRLQQFRVTEYRLRQQVMEPDGLAAYRRVTLRLYHVRSAREIAVMHEEIWRYDPEFERWLLHSGLPDVSQ